MALSLSELPASLSACPSCLGSSTVEQLSGGPHHDTFARQVEEGVSIEDISLDLHDGSAIVTWSWLHSGYVHTSLVTFEACPADPSVGYFSAYVEVDGDCPKDVLDRVAADAEEALVDRWESRRDDAADARYEQMRDERGAA